MNAESATSAASAIARNVLAPAASDNDKQGRFSTEAIEAICPELDAERTTIVSRTGDHHFDRNYPAIAQDILKALPTK